MKGSTTVGIAVVVLGGGVAWYVRSKRDKTPVGLVITTQGSPSLTVGTNSDGKDLTAGAVEGTWRADEDSLSVFSESAERPLMVIYEDGTPVDAKVIDMVDYYQKHIPPTECDDGGSVEDCQGAMTELNNEAMKIWRELAKDAGATEESIDANFPLQETATQAAESIFGPMMSLQSHFVW
jgi:hypothetical protein